MREFVSSVSPKGQITLPAEVREALGIKPKDKVAMTVEDGTVKVSLLSDDLEAIFQSVPALSRPLDDEEITDIAWEEHVRHVAEEGLDR